MTGLWNPSKVVRSDINRGERKEKIGRLKTAKEIIAIPCPACDSHVYYNAGTDKYLTLSGSEHKCVGLKEFDE